LSSVVEQPQTTKKRGGRQPGRTLRYAKRLRARPLTPSPGALPYGDGSAARTRKSGLSMKPRLRRPKRVIWPSGMRSSVSRSTSGDGCSKWSCTCVAIRQIHSLSWLRMSQRQWLWDACQNPRSRKIGRKSAALIVEEFGIVALIMNPINERRSPCDIH